MLRGPATINIWADDVEAAKDWYAEVLGVQPYFERKDPSTGKPAYYEFRIGDYQTELGLIDARFRPTGPAAGPGGAVVNWYVDDLAGSFERLLSLGAKELEKITERGSGFVTASVIDPFGNILAIMTNPHYLEVLAAR